VFDLWAQQWRQRKAHGAVVLVRYADDFVVGFERRAEAEQFWRELTERFHQFNLELHADKTRLIEFGCHAAENRRKRGEGKPETFHFLGFTHICEKSRKGRFTILRQTMRKRMQAKLKLLKMELWRRMHEPVPEQGKWLRMVVNGHFRYFGVPRNRPALNEFRYRLVRLWKEVLERRSQKSEIEWERMERLARRWLPYSRIYHPYPWQRWHVKT
jgi:RNA-directed DNA polymerase